MSAADEPDRDERGPPSEGRPPPAPARLYAPESPSETPRAKPTPARSMGAAEAGVGVDSDVPPGSSGLPAEETRLLIDDVSWTVTVLGRAGSSSVGRAPLLLLGFRRDNEEDAEVLEAFVVGTEIDGLSSEALTAAHATSRHRPPRPAGSAASPPPDGRSRRGRG